MGFRLGDVIQSINGEDLSNVGAVQLPQYLAQFDGQDVSFGVSRQDGEAITTVEIVVPGYQSALTYETSQTHNALGALTSLGIA